MKKLIFNLFLSLLICVPVANSMIVAPAGGLTPQAITTIAPAADGQTTISNFSKNTYLKPVQTNNTKIVSSIQDVTISTKNGHKKTFENIGYIPMTLVVKNDTNNAITLNENPFKHCLNIPNQKAIKLITKNIKLKKAGAYLCTLGYYSLAAASVAGATPLIACGASAAFPYISQIPSTLYELVSTYNVPYLLPTISGIGAISTLAFLSPNQLTKVSNTIVDNYYNVSKSFWPSTVINEFNEMLEILEEMDQNVDHNIPANSSRTFIIFLKKIDRDKINLDILIPELNFV